MTGFSFKQFTVNHDRCAMKVGTDGVLLGAWANGGKRILDVGTGSGLIALFMAQRFPDAHITAIDIDHDAYMQATINAEVSVFSKRITVVESSFQDFSDNMFDAIVCNPPFFNNSLKCKDKQRNIARHTDTLPFHDLFKSVSRSLDENGEFSVIIPAACRTDFDMEGLFAGLFIKRICAIKTLPHKPVSRYLIAYTKKISPQIEITEEYINDESMRRSKWYASLTENFYL